eukprot:5290336-Alexandrium_andersonii.AAC.1
MSHAEDEAASSRAARGAPAVIGRKEEGVAQLVSGHRQGLPRSAPWRAGGSGAALHAPLGLGTRARRNASAAAASQQGWP